MHELPKRTLNPRVHFGGLMAKQDKKHLAAEDIKLHYLTTGSIRATVKATGKGRNTVRKLLKESGLHKQSFSKRERFTEPAALPAAGSRNLSSYSSLAELLNKTTTEDAISSDFKKYLFELEANLLSYFGIDSEIDKMRLEMAILQFTIYRRFFMRSLEASQKYPIGRFVKSDQKHIREIRDWVDVADKSLDRFNQLMRELEVRYGKRSPETQRANVFVQNQLNVVK